MPPCHGGGRGFESRPVRKKPLSFRGFFVFGMFYVYILQSDVDASFYIGYTANLELRLEQHNNGEATFSRRKKPWKLVYSELYSDKTEALKREKFLKKQKNKNFYNSLIKAGSR